MEGSGSAVAYEHITVEVATKDLVKVLVIDDDPVILDSLKRLFEGEGHEVAIASSPEEAEQLLKHSNYDLVITDIWFGEGVEVTGDQLIIENRANMTGATIVAMTGWGLDRIKRNDILKEMEVQVIEKGGDNDLGDILQILHEKRSQRKRQMAELAQRYVHQYIENESAEKTSSISIHTTSPFSAPKYLLDNLQQILADWFRTRSNPNSKTILYGGKIFSANEMASEIERGTEIGLEHLEILIDMFKECINLK